MVNNPVIPDLHSTEAQKSYAGPGELKMFADALPFFGELAISFSYVERRLTWAIMALLGSTMHEANEMESVVQNFTSRLTFLHLTGLPVARETKTEPVFEEIIGGLATANTFRNSLFHNGFAGVGMAHFPGGAKEFSVVKSRFHKTPGKRAYQISTAKIRGEAEKNFALCTEIQTWILRVRPKTDNSVP